MATSAAIDFAVDLSRSVVYVESGYLRPAYYGCIPWLVVVAFAGSYVGKRILARISQNQFRHFVLAMIAAIGAVLVVRSLMQPVQDQGGARPASEWQRLAQFNGRNG